MAAVLVKCKKIAKKISPFTIGAMIYCIGPQNLIIHFVHFLNSRSRDLFMLTLVSGFLANTSADERINQFWQSHIRRTPGLNRLLTACKPFGEYGMHVAYVLFFAFILREKLTTTKPEADALEQWTSQTLSNLASCVLIQGISCAALGGARPISKAKNPESSPAWRPVLYLKELTRSRYFLKERMSNSSMSSEKKHEHSKPLAEKEGHAVSGRAALSAFIATLKEGRAVSGHAALSAFTATLGTEIFQYYTNLNEPTQKLLFNTVAIAVATGGTLSRVNNEAHYFSQAFTGAAVGTMTAAFNKGMTRSIIHEL